MLTEKMIRKIISNRIKAKIEEGLQPGSAAHAAVNVAPATPATATSTTTAGSVVPGSSGTVGASRIIYSQPTDDTSFPKLGHSDKQEFDALANILEIERNNITGFDPSEPSLENDIMQAIMKKINDDEDAARGAEEIFGDPGGIEAKLRSFYTKDITPKDLFGASDPDVQTALTGFTAALPYNPTITSTTKWMSGDPVRNNNYRPFYWIKFMVEKNFDLSGLKATSVKYDNKGRPIFDAKNLDDFSSQTEEVFGELYDIFETQYREITVDVYQGGGMRGVLGYLDDNEVLAYSVLLKKLIENDIDSEKLPMTRMFFAYLGASEWLGDASLGGVKQEALGIYAVGEDGRYVEAFNNRTIDITNVDSATVASGDIISDDAQQFYKMAYDMTKEAGSLLSRAMRLPADVDDSIKNQQLVVRKILERTPGYNASLAIKDLDIKSGNIKAYKEQIEVDLGSFEVLLKGKKEEYGSLNESYIRSEIQKILLEKKKTKSNEYQGVKLDATFTNMPDANGYVLIYPRPQPSVDMITLPRIHTSTTDTKGSQPKTAYELAWYASFWETNATAISNKYFMSTNDPDFPEQMARHIHALYSSSNVSEFNLEKVIVVKATDLFRLSKKLNAGTPPSGLAITPGVTPGTISATDINTFNTWFYSQDFILEFNACKESFNSLNLGILQFMKKKDPMGKDLYDYMSFNKDKFNIGKDMGTKYGDALKIPSADTVDPVEAKKLEDIRDAINKMYEYFKGMDGFDAGARNTALEKERDDADKKIEFAIKSPDMQKNHPTFVQALQTLALRKFNKNSASFKDVVGLSTNFHTFGPRFGYKPQVHGPGLLKLVMDLASMSEVNPRDKIKSTAVYSGAVIDLGDFVTKIIQNPDTVLVPAYIPTSPNYTVNPTRAENALSEFSNLLKDSSNTLNQPIKIKLDVSGGITGLKLDKIEGRLGGNIKIGLRRWVKRSLIPSFTAIDPACTQMEIVMPVGKYVSKLSENKSKTAKEIITAIKKLI